MDRGWIGFAWIVLSSTICTFLAMDRGHGSGWIGFEASRVVLSSTTCAFSAMGWRMDRDGSGWIGLEASRVDRALVHDLCVFSDGSVDGS